MLGYMAQSDNLKLVSHKSGFDSRQFLFFSCVYRELKNDKSKHKNKNITICIVGPSELCITCISQ